MTRSLLTFLFCFSCLFVFSQDRPWQGPSVDLRHGKLKVSANKRFLQFSDGTPFLYLGDTGWELFHRLSKPEIETYLENRRLKGFTVIQAVVLAELDGLNTPNAEGFKPLTDNNPLKPNEKYFELVDWTIKLAAQKGLFIGLLPTWGDKVDKQWGVGPEIFDWENAYLYGKWISNRYKDAPNLIWILGGDRNGGGKNKEIWDAMAKGIKEVDKTHLMTLHPWGEHSSSEWFQQSSWLDFNMMQTGHAQRSYSIYKRLLINDYSLQPIKPTFDGEPRYEDHPVNWKPEELGWFNDADIRQSMYWGLFSGGMGSTYGCHPIWQFLSKDKEPIGLARHTWQEDLDLPGSWDLIHARRLLESRPFLSRVPDPSMVKDPYFPETDMVVATRGDGYALVYFPTGNKATISAEPLKAKTITASWYNPRTGKTESICTYPGNELRTFEAPSNGRGNDWILILDDTSRHFPNP